jgi:hypothetical protein
MTRSLPLLLALCAGTLALAAPAHADGWRWPWQRADCSPCPPAPCAPVVACEVPAPVLCVRQTIPACFETRTRTVEVAAVTCQVRVPTYENVEVPVYQTKCTPEYRDVEVPVYAHRTVPVYAERQVPRYESFETPIYRTRSVPVYTTRKVARYENVDVPCYEHRRVPITQEVCDPSTGAFHTVVCGYRTETFQSGTRSERRLAGYDDEQVQCGTRCERYQDGTQTGQRLAGYTTERYQSGTRQERFQADTRTEQVFVRNRSEVVQTGVRTERRLAGHTTEERILCPARTHVVTERVAIPARSVTVAVGAPVDQVTPLDGTTEVLSQAGYDREVARARAMGR